MFVGSPLRHTAAVVFVALLCAACVWDVRARRIPNWVSASLAVGGLLFSLAEHDVGRGLGIAFGGMMLGLLLWFPSYVFRLLGAGDVKLFAAAGAWLGPVRTFEAALIAGLIGGAMAVVWLVRFRGLQGTAVTMWAARMSPSTLVQPRTGPPTRQHLPYSIALSAGVAIAAWLPRHLI
ncbi:MAG: A24 family peptidase [Gemmatimonadaceae bacterium]